MFFVIIANQLLIKRKINLMRGYGCFIIFGDIDFMDNAFQRRKIPRYKILRFNLLLSRR